MVKLKRNSKEQAVLEVQAEEGSKENVELNSSSVEDTKETETTKVEVEEEGQPQKKSENTNNETSSEKSEVENTDEKKEEVDGKKEVQPVEKVKRATSLRKKLSFIKKKKPKDNPDKNQGEIKMNGNHTQENGSIKRSHSLSNSKKEGSKIPLGKFRTLPFKKKHMSASLDLESKNKVKDSGQDEWRMTGLLDTVAKSNSMASLNGTSKSSVNENTPPAVALVPSPRKDDEKSTAIFQQAEEVKNESIIETVTEEEPPAVFDDEEKEVNTTTPDEPFVKTDIDYDQYSAEKNNEPTTSSDNKDKISETQESEIKNKTETPKKIIITTIQEKAQVVFEEDKYELCDDNISVTIRNLREIVEEKQWDFPQEVTPNDWLVLNLSPISSC